MTTTEKGVSPALIIRVPGKALNAQASKAFRAEAMDKIKGQKRVVIDLSDLTFVDSSGLGVLIACLRNVNGAGGDLKLCGLGAEVRALFELVRMHHLFAIYNTCDEAVRAFK